MALIADADRAARLLIIPALFDESNRLRRFTAEVMRRLDTAGVDCFLPDLPGCHDSLAPLEQQSLASWADAVKAAARHFRASHVLTIRGGALLVPPTLLGWRYAPLQGASLLKQMLRARQIARREAGVIETHDGLMQQALAEGLELAGYRLGPQMIDDLQTAAPPEETRQSIIGQDLLGGPGLWLRAEPDEDAEQADALAAIIAIGIKA